MKWEPFVAAAFAPLIVWLLWRLQAATVNRVLRPGLYKLLRHQRRTYAVVSWLGVFLHELAHATILILGLHGVRRFNVKVDSGHVTPRQIRRGPIGLLTFIAAALAPIYAAPGIILLLMAILVAPGLLRVHAAGVGLHEAWDALQGVATTLTQDLVLGIARLDLATASGAAVFLLAVLAMPAARPSFVKGEERDEGDIAVVRAKVRQHPWTIVATFLVIYGLYFALVPFAPVWYWAAFQVVWAIAITGIVLGVLGGVGWWLAARAGRAHPAVNWAPITAALAAQVVPRVLDLPLGPLTMNALSGISFVVLALVLPALVPRRGLGRF